MKKVVLAIGGVVVLVIAYWLISPLFIVTMSYETLEMLPGAGMESTVLAHGEFEDGEPGHHAKGDVVLLRLSDGSNAVRFEDDFEVTNGPDLFVYLGRDGMYDKETNLGSLKGSKGSQNYIIPIGIDVSKYNEVWVWCRAFSVKFGAAELLSS